MPSLSLFLFQTLSVAGLLALKKSAIALPMMIPLLIITVLFNAYIQQQHFRVAEYLPARACTKTDVNNYAISFNFSFLEDAYLQPELRVKKLFLDTAELEQELPAILQHDADLHYLTPEQSEAEHQSENDITTPDNGPVAGQGSETNSSNASFLGWHLEK